MLNIAPNNRLNVLLAHDSDGWQDTVCRLLEPQGVQTVAVRSGRDALDIIQNTQIHVAILDQQMPHLGGLQVIKLMRDIKTAPPSILVTSHLTDHLLHEALGMHVFSVLSKPVDLNLLLDALARILKRRYASRWPTEPETH